MRNDATYSLWLEPSGKVGFRLQERIKKLSEKYDTPMFAPHVTLLGGLKASKTELISLVDTLAHTLQPFELTLTTVDRRSRYYQALFIHVEKTKALMSLRKTAERFFNTSNNEDYMPHLSLLYGDFSPQQKELMLNDAGREFYLNFSVKTLVLMQTNGSPKHWVKIYTAIFGDT